MLRGFFVIFLLCAKTMRILRSGLVVAGMQVVDEAIPCLPVMRSFASVFPTAFGALTTTALAATPCASPKSSRLSSLGKFRVISTDDLSRFASVGVRDRLEQDLQNLKKTRPYLATRNRSPKQLQILGAEFDHRREPDFRGASKQFSENSSACRPSTRSPAERRKVVANSENTAKKTKFALRKTLDNNSTTMPNSSTHHRHRSCPRRPNLSGLSMCQSGLRAASTCILTLQNVP